MNHLGEMPGYRVEIDPSVLEAGYTTLEFYVEVFAKEWDYFVWTCLKHPPLFAGPSPPRPRVPRARTEGEGGGLPQATFCDATIGVLGRFACHPPPWPSGGSAHPRTPLGGTIGTLRAPTGRKRWGAGRQMQGAVGGEPGMETAKGKAKALQGMLGGTVFKSKVESQGTGTDA